MKITDVTTFVVGNPPPHHGGRYWIFLKLTTDGGVEGIGEAYSVPFHPRVVVLWDLVECREEEWLVILGFLHVLAQSEAGNALERQVRRQILKACKTDKPHQTVLDAVTYVYDGWQNRNAMEGSRP